MRIVAIDPSLQCSGVCDSQAPDEPFTLVPPAGLAGMARLRWIRGRVVEVTKGADLVVIEGYSHGSRYQAHYLGELGGVIRLMLYCLGRPTWTSRRRSAPRSQQVVGWEEKTLSLPRRSSGWATPDTRRMKPTPGGSLSARFSTTNCREGRSFPPSTWSRSRSRVRIGQRLNCRRWYESRTSGCRSDGDP